jgi:hypothetical protein
MTESEAKLIESMADDYSNVLKEAKSMGCNDIRALYNIPLKNMELIINALEKQIPKKPIFTEDKQFALCPCCDMKGLTDKQKYCDNCGQKLDWSDEE